MHFRSDEKFLKLTKILEIKNKGELSGVCSDIPPAKMILSQNLFGRCVLKHRNAGGGYHASGWSLIRLLLYLFTQAEGHNIISPTKLSLHSK